MAATMKFLGQKQTIGIFKKSWKWNFCDITEIFEFLENNNGVNETFLWNFQEEKTELLELNKELSQ